MKKYLGILLALAMTSCGDTTGGGGNGGSEDTLKEDVTREFVGIQRDTTPYNANDIMSKNAIGSTSDSYRIPAVILTKANRLIVTSDARWGGSADSANNIDSAYRYSDDGGKNWSRVNFFQHFDDFSDVNNYETTGDKSKQSYSASFIDPGIVEAPNGDIVSITTVFSWGAGLFNWAPGNAKGTTVAMYVKGTGADASSTYLKLRHKDNKAMSGDMFTEASFEYKVKVSGTWAEGELREVTLLNGDLVTAADKQFKVNKYYDVFNMDNSKLEVDQYKIGNSVASLVKNGTETIQANLLYYESPYHIVPKNMLFMARSTDGGSSFQKPYDVSWQVFNEKIMLDRQQWFAGVSPGVGFQDRKGRILFAIQQVPKVNGNGGNNCQAMSMYSDDNGDTWKLGKETINLNGQGGKVDRFSESQYLATPDENQLILIGRTKPNNRVMYAISIDRGDTWSDPTNTVLANCGNIGSMVGAANLYKSTVFGKPMIAITHVGNPSAKGDAINIVGRKMGTMSIGYLEEGGTDGTIMYENKKVWVPTFTGAQVEPGTRKVLPGDTKFWTYANNANPNEEFAYSMPIELPNGNIGWFYEGKGYQGGRGNVSHISWQEVRLDRSGKETTPIFAKP